MTHLLLMPSRALAAFFVAAIILISTQLVAAQTLRESFGTNSRAQDPVDWQNQYPLIREYHLWADDQGYDSDITPNWPANNFEFGVVDQYYERLNSAVVQTAFGIPGEMRGLMGTGADLKWILQKPLIPVEEPLAPAPFQLGATETTSTGLFFGDWLVQNVNQETPAAWILKAHYATLLAQRYGSSTLPPGAVRALHKPTTGGSTYVFPQTESSGRTNWFEAENEPDRTWFDPGREDQPNAMWQHLPNMLAAQTSMLYDGHGKSDAAIWPVGGSAKFKLGVRNVSSDNKVAVAGLAGLRGKLVNEMVQWFIANRRMGVHDFQDYSAPVLPFDALSFHHYAASNSAGPSAEYAGAGQWDPSLPGAEAQSPETHGLRARMEFLIENLYTDISNQSGSAYQEMAGKEIWLSEFGYDDDNLAPGECFECPDCPYDPNSGCAPGQGAATGGIQIPELMNVNDPTGPSLNKELVQAQWLARSYLELMAVSATVPSLAGETSKGVDRFMQYELGDPPIKPDDEPGRQQFQSSGLLNKDGSPKAAHFFTRTLLHHLGEYEMDKSPGNDAPNSAQFPASLGSALSIVTGNQGPVPMDGEDHPIVYKFDQAASGNNATNLYAIWSPTESGYNYEVELDMAELMGSSVSEITIVRLESLSERGVIESVTSYTDGKFRFNVTEEPLLLRAGTPDINTNVAPPRALNSEDLCCGDARFLISRNSRQLNSAFTIAYAPQSLASANGTMPVGALTIVDENFFGRQIVISGLDPGESYYFFALPQNSAGYGYSYANGVPITLGFDPAYPDLAVAHLHFASTCDDGGNGCNYTINADQITMVTADPTNLGTVATVLSGGTALTEGYCAPEAADGSGWAAYDGDNGGVALSVAVVDFDTPINIDRLALWELGATPNAPNPGVTIEYATCDCPNIWKPYIRHNWSTFGQRTSYSRRASRVVKLRISKRSMGLGGLSLCAEETTCLRREFTEEPIVNVDEVGTDFGRVSWVPAFDTASQSTPDGYVIQLSKGLTDAGYLREPTQQILDARNGNVLAQKFDGLDPGATYFGRLVPDRNCLQSVSSIDAEPRPYSPTDSSFFTFTLPTAEGSELRAPESRIGDGLAESERTFVSPNPVQGLLTVRAPGAITSVRVHDVVGRLVHSLAPQQAVVDIDFSGLAPGTYSVTVVTATTRETHLVQRAE